MTRRHDVAIVGAGPNGLVAAAYLARAGADVIVLEKRFERGGTFATDDFSTPFTYNLAQFDLPLGRDLQAVRDLALLDAGLAFVEPSEVFRVDDLSIGRGGAGLGGGLPEAFARASQVVTPLLCLPAEEAARELEGCEIELAGLSPDDLVDRAASPAAEVAVRYACVRAGFVDGEQPLGAIGAFCIGRAFSPSLVAGGTKNLANILVRVAARHGARCLVTSEVQRLEPAAEHVAITTFDQRQFLARAVISTVDLETTFRTLLDPRLVPAEAGSAVERLTLDGPGPFTAHFGVKGQIATDSAPLHTIIGFHDGLEVLEHARAIRRGELPSGIGGHLTVVTAHDPLQASPGPYGPLHTLRMEALVPYTHPSGSWDTERRAFRTRCFEAARRHVPGLDGVQLLQQFCDSPRDLERRFTTSREGSIRQGALTPAQTLTGRALGSGARTPIARLYLGGGAAHPGVPGTLGGGYNAAGAVCEDLGFTMPEPVSQPAAMTAGHDAQ